MLFGGLDEGVLLGLHRGMWTIHFAAVAVAFATLPLTNLFHIFTSPINIFVAPFRVKGASKPITNLETAEQLGVKKLADLPWPWRWSTWMPAPNAVAVRPCARRTQRINP